VILKVQAQTYEFMFSQKKLSTEANTLSGSTSSSSKYANENNIQKLDQKNIIDGYFKIFNESHTEVEIKNMIAARLQPAYQLPQVHDHKTLSLKAKELLNFSFTI
jgi:hypothetical protein